MSGLLTCCPVCEECARAFEQLRAEVERLKADLALTARVRDQALRTHAAASAQLAALRPVAEAAKRWERSPLWSQADPYYMDELPAERDLIVEVRQFNADSAESEPEAHDP